MSPDPQAPASALVQPVEAWAAVSRSGRIAMASSHSAEDAWRLLIREHVCDSIAEGRRNGWRVIPVRIVPVEDA